MKVYEVGPFQEFSINGENVSDTRDFSSFERDMRTYLPEFPITRKGLMHDVASRFPEEVLYILEAGCGIGGLLIDLKDAAESEKINACTTGVTMDPNHARRAHNSNIDTMIIGSVQNYFKRGGRNSYHLLVDYYGAASYDWPPYGATTLPIYFSLLKRRGIAILGSSLVLGLQDPQQEIGVRNKFIAKCGFTIISSANGFSVLEK
ncbi:hypothetical protein KBD75_00755 [Candidatus Woesebacteria bacterium]|nr:hypothetical protein [Candidatus Woesebacteria bacterium]